MPLFLSQSACPRTLFSSSKGIVLGGDKFVHWKKRKAKQKVGVLASLLCKVAQCKCS